MTNRAQYDRVYYELIALLGQQAATELVESLKKMNHEQRTELIKAIDEFIDNYPPSLLH